MEQTKSNVIQKKFNAEEREKLILDMLPQVKFRALRIYNNINRSVELSELISAGVLGLLDAVDRFDPDKGVKFQTYADLRIEGAIKDCLRQLDWASRGHRQKKKLYENTYRQLQEKLDRTPCDEEIAAELGMDKEQWRKFLPDVMVMHIGSFTELRESDSDERQIIFQPETDESTSPHYVFERNELLEILTDEIRRLAEKEALVLSLYYYEELNMKEIGAVLNVTESRVSQIHNTAILRLKARLKTTVGPRFK